MTNLNEIRTEFLDFFEKNNHTVLPSSPVIPQNDPTFLFIMKSPKSSNPLH